MTIDSRKEFPIATSPIYSHRRPNQPIPLYRGPLRRIDATAVTHRGDLWLQWQPSPWIRFGGNPIGKPNFGDLLSDLDIQLVPALDTPLTVKPQPGRRRFAVSGQLSRVDRGSADGLSRLVFNVSNLPEFFGEVVQCGDTLTSARTTFAAGGWTIVMDPIGNLKATIEQLRDRGGFAFTHVVEVRRTTGELFGADSAEDILQALYYFLSFVRGALCAPVLPVGFSAGGDAVWAGWRSPIIDPFRFVTTWVDPVHPEAMAATFPGFMQRWGQARWRDPLRISIESYAKANTPTPMELAVATGQIVHELLAATILVEELGLLSKGAFKKLTAAEAMQLALRVMDIPIGIPAGLLHLTRYAAGQSGPEATTRLRNSVIHSAERRLVDRAIWSDAWRLSTWYVEMALLWAFGFSGAYGSRLIESRWVGAVDPVPWVQSQASQGTDGEHC